MERWYLEGLIAEVIIAEWHYLGADFLWCATVRFIIM